MIRECICLKYPYRLASSDTSCPNFGDTIRSIWAVRAITLTDNAGPLRIIYRRFLKKFTSA